MAHREIPTRFHYSSNSAAEHNLQGLGKKVLSKLEEDIGFNDLDIGSKTIKLDDGSTITAASSFGETNVHIQVPEIEVEEPVEGGCLCGKYFSEGVVMDVHPVNGYVEAAQLYTVDVCQRDNTKITVTGCVAQDFTVFQKDDRVWCCLTVREVIAMRPYTFAADVDEFLFSACYGCMGTEKGYSTDINSYPQDYSVYEGAERPFIAGLITETNYYANEEKGIGNIAPWQWEHHRPINRGWGCCFPRYYYENVNWIAMVPLDATLATGAPLDVSDDFWGGKYPHMCMLSADISSPFWLCNDSVTTGLKPMGKQAKWLYCEYAMLETKQSGSGGIPPIFKSEVDGNTPPGTPLKKYEFNLQIMMKS